MIKWLINFFKSKAPSVIIGATYCFIDDINNPFKKSLVTVKDVKDGYVLYDMGMVFHNETLEISLFNRLYKLHKANKEK